MVYKVCLLYLDVINLYCIVYLVLFIWTSVWLVFYLCILLFYLRMFITFLNEDVGWFMYIRLVYYHSVSYELSVFDVQY